MPGITGVSRDITLWRRQSRPELAVNADSGRQRQDNRAAFAAIDKSKRGSGNGAPCRAKTRQEARHLGLPGQNSQDDAQATGLIERANDVASRTSSPNSGSRAVFGDKRVQDQRLFNGSI